MARSSTTFPRAPGNRKRVDAFSMAVQAAEELQRQALRVCFSADDLQSRANRAQNEVLRGIQEHAIRYVVAGNQCLPGDALVMTPSGPRRLDALVVGDVVYDERGAEQRVVRTWANGPKEIGDLTARGRPLAACTAEHKWWTNFYSRVDGELLQTRKAPACELGSDMAVARSWVTAPLGQVSNLQAYALGAFLGDGCSREKSRSAFYISSSDSGVPEKVASILGGTATKCSSGNYTWVVRAEDCAHYNEWCRGRYAHEKTVDMAVIRSWDRPSLLNFVAGLLDTDGSVHKCKDFVALELGMQAKPVVDAFAYAVLALWQVQLSTQIDTRAKYKNGPIYSAYTRNTHEIRRILAELDSYTVKSTRKWQPEYDQIGGKRSRPDAVKLTWGSNRRVVETHDITVSGAHNVYMLANGLVTSNSGKTSLAIREGTWLLEDTHPYFKKPPEWGTGPLLALVVGQDRAQLENMWLTRIRPLLSASEWKEQRSGSVLQSVSHRTKGHQIVFLSHNNSSEDDIKHLQYYSAHWVWCDEMPKQIRVLEELQRRVDAKRGRFICTFTMKYRNDSIRKMVDASDGVVSRKYQLNKLDNPIYRGREEEELAKLAALPADLREAILTGKWITSDTHVYQVVPELHCGKPEGYNPSWRHVAVVDPATESKLGLTVWAEKPTTEAKLPGEGVWWCIVAEYIEGLFVPTLIISAVERILHPLNVVKRVYDNEAAWYANQARQMGFRYVPVPNKSNRKQHFTARFQEALGPKIRIADWCTKLLAELESCERSEINPDKIANKSRFHLIDSSHYFVECTPPPDVTRQYSSTADYLIAYDNQRRQAEYAAAKRKLDKIVRTRRALHPGRRRAWTR